MHVRGLIMSEISNAFEHFIILLMKSDLHFLNQQYMYVYFNHCANLYSSVNSTPGNLTPK